MTADAELLDASSVVAHLVARGVLSSAADAGQVEALGGGVSNVVLAVDTAAGRVVVKQALPQLRVEQEWLADPARADTEAAALRLAAGITPGAVPAVLDVDLDRHALVLEAAPSSWVDWKQELLAGSVDATVAGRVGAVAAAWHAATTGLEGDAAFDQPEAFDQLRLDPYYRATALVHTDLAATIGERLEQLARARTCLVHGDLSPKNVLVGEGDLWVIDFEVAHVGHPAFDLAFLLNHLFLKAAHRPGSFDELRAAATAFWAAYEGGGGLQEAAESALAHHGVLMLARVDGKSPVEYLDEPARERVRTVARSLVTDVPRSLDEAWDRAGEVWR